MGGEKERATKKERERRKEQGQNRYSRLFFFSHWFCHFRVLDGIEMKSFTMQNRKSTNVELESQRMVGDQRRRKKYNEPGE